MTAFLFWGAVLASGVGSGFIWRWLRGAGRTRRASAFAALYFFLLPFGAWLAAWFGFAIFLSQYAGIEQKEALDTAGHAVLAGGFGPLIAVAAVWAVLLYRN